MKLQTPPQKKCRGCSKMLEATFDNFPPAGANSGLGSRCRPCRNAYSNENQKKNRLLKAPKENNDWGNADWMTGECLYF